MSAIGAFSVCCCAIYESVRFSKENVRYFNESVRSSNEGSLSLKTN